jgi:hypothetical protein
MSKFELVPNFFPTVVWTLATDSVSWDGCQKVLLQCFTGVLLQRLHSCIFCYATTHCCCVQVIAVMNQLTKKERQRRNHGQTFYVNSHLSIFSSVLTEENVPLFAIDLQRRCSWLLKVMPQLNSLAVFLTDSLPICTRLIQNSRNQPKYHKIKTASFSSNFFYLITTKPKKQVIVFYWVNIRRLCFSSILWPFLLKTISQKQKTRRIYKIIAIAFLKSNAKWNQLFF